MSCENLTFAIINYAGAMQSAVWGWQEMIALANRLLKADKSVETRFITCKVISEGDPLPELGLDCVMIPPCMDESAPQVADDMLKWLGSQAGHGAVMSSACAGAFVLAETGLLSQRHATTHWALADDFRSRFTDIELVEDEILVDEGDVVTAGGLMSWVDLGLAMIARFTHQNIVTVLGKQLVVDSAPRQQKYYRRFIPILNHGDEAVLIIQNYLKEHFSQVIKLSELGQFVSITERTLQRRFLNATGMTSQQYLNKLRMQFAADQLENTQQTFEVIAYSVGYNDVSACRKLFKKEFDLSPKEYRNRFRNKN